METRTLDVLACQILVNDMATMQALRLLVKTFCIGNIPEDISNMLSGCILQSDEIFRILSDKNESL
jgi:hypothetical protein